MDASFDDMLGGDIVIEDMLGDESSFDDMLGVKPKKIAPVKVPEKTAWPKSIFEVQMETYKPLLGDKELPEPKSFITEEDRQAFVDTLKGYGQLAMHPEEFVRGTADFIFSIPGFLTGLATAGQRTAKGLLDQLVLGQTLNLEELYTMASEGMEEGMRFFEPGKELLLGKSPEEAQLVGRTVMAPVMAISAAFHSLAEYPLFGDSPNIRGVLKFGGDITGLLTLGMMYRGARGEVPGKIRDIASKANEIKTKEQAIEGIPDEAIRRAQKRVLEVQKQQVEAEAESFMKDIETKIDLKEILKESLRKKGEEVKAVKEEPTFRGEVPPEGYGPAMETAQETGATFDGWAPKGYAPEGYSFTLTEKVDPVFKGRETSLAVKDLEDLPGRIAKKTEEFKKVLPKETEIDWFGEKEPVTELDRQTGIEVPEIRGERSPFYQTAEEAAAFKKIYGERAKAVSEDVEVFTQKIINDANNWHHGDASVDITAVRDTLSKLAARADEFRMDFLEGRDHLAWKETVSDAAEWARGLRSKIEQRPEGTKLYSGLPLDAMGQAIVDGAKRFKGYVDHARGIRKFRPLDAARLLNQEFKRNFVDRSGNIRLELLDKLGDVGHNIVQKMYLTKGANSLAANMLQQMRKEVYSGLNRSEKTVLDSVILAERMADIGKYKTAKEFRFPDGLRPTETAAYLELFPQLEKLTPDRAQLVKDRARAYFEWMKKPLKDMLDAELISQEEYNNLASHNYRRIKLVDIFDRRYQAKVGKRKRTVYDSGVEALAKGRKTDIYEPSSEIMALEVFNRAYGRILNNEANRSLLDLARSDPKNPFVRYRTKGQSIPSGWQRIFVYEGGQRKAIYLSPDMAKEWITNNPEMSYRMGQFLRWISGSPVLRTFATGINWGFALANLPRDVMHTYFAARMFDGKEWRGVYSSHLPIFIPQVSADLARTFTDAATRGKRYQKYIEEGGGMEFLVHQGRLFARGRRLESPLDKVQNFMGYFGETTEIMTRLAIRDRVIRRRAREQGLTMEQARKNKDITREATFAARDYMDFGQGGGITKAADNALPYLNAAVQGTRGLWRVARENPGTFAYKVAQIGAATTILYAAMREQAPLTTEALQGDIDMQNNLCIPWGDSFGFEDEKGQMRYPYWKVPLDPSQKFFKTFFEAAYDKTMGYEVDVDRVTNNLLEQSPVGVSSLPPTVSGTLGYIQNRDFWLNEDIWRKTEKPFDWPRSKEEFIPGRTPEFYVDVGEITGLSPERTRYTVEELTTSGTLWSYLLGKGYDELFADVPEEKREQHIAMVLSEIPIAKRFVGVTNPYSKYATEIEKEADVISMEHWKQRRELDRLTEGYLFEKSVERVDVFKYIRSFREPRVRDRLQDRFDFQYAVRSLPERSFWLRLQHLDPEIRARRYYAREQAASPEEREQLAKERSIIGSAGGFFSDTFWDELNKLRRGKEVVE